MRIFYLTLTCFVSLGCDQTMRHIDCLDGCNRVAVDGEPGANGKDGSNGLNGFNGSNGSDGFSLVSVTLALAPGCPNGGYTLIVAQDTNRSGFLEVSEDSNVQSAELCNGADGRDGVNGTNGSNGTNGTDGHDGVNGTNGHDGAAAQLGPYAPVDLVVPCPSVPGSFRETFLKLQNGTVIASFSDTASGQNTRFTQVVPGTYVTTDGRNCLFTMHNDGSFSW